MRRARHAEGQGPTAAYCHASMVRNTPATNPCLAAKRLAIMHSHDTGPDITPATAGLDPPAVVRTLAVMACLFGGG